MDAGAIDELSSGENALFFCGPPSFDLCWERGQEKWDQAAQSQRNRTFDQEKPFPCRPAVLSIQPDLGPICYQSVEGSGDAGGGVEDGAAGRQLAVGIPER